MDNVEFFQNIANDKRNNGIVNSSFKLRHRVFNERLNWKVVSRDDSEVDCFDNEDTWYAVLRNNQNDVVGTWRALPTTGDYMLRSVFPQMARGELMPSQKRIWEISRFAIDKSKRTKPEGREYICKESKALIQSFYEFSYKHNIEQLVAVTSVAAERMMKDLDVKLRRLGDGKAVRIGKVLTTAVLIDIPKRDESIYCPQEVNFTKAFSRLPVADSYSELPR